MRKQIGVTIWILCVFGGVGRSQTPYGITNVALEKDSTRGTSAANPWLGAKIGYKFGGTKEFQDNLLVSARLLHNIEVGTDKFKLPVMGNIADLTTNVSEDADAQEELEQKAQQLISSSSGATVGLYPYYVALQKTALSIVLHGESAWKLNSFKDPDDKSQFLNAGRFSGGVEIAVGESEGGQKPLTFSITPVLTVFDSKEYALIFGTPKARLRSLEMTLIVPVAKGVGFLLERSSGRDATSSVRAGLLFSR